MPNKAQRIKKQIRDEKKKQIEKQMKVQELRNSLQQLKEKYYTMNPDEADRLLFDF